MGGTQPRCLSVPLARSHSSRGPHELDQPWLSKLAQDYAQLTRDLELDKDGNAYHLLKKTNPTQNAQIGRRDLEPLSCSLQDDRVISCGSSHPHAR